MKEIKKLKPAIRGKNRDRIFRLLTAFTFMIAVILNANPSFGSSSYDQPIRVSGTITDENGSPFPGVNIQVEGTTIGAISDINGKYSLEVPKRDAVLVFTFVGYTSQKVPISGKTTIDIKMAPDVMNLEEVVVVGYGTQRKKDITGAISVVSTDNLKTIPTGDAVQALQGLASGVTVIGSGVPGGRTDIFIRGVTSLGNTSPLVIVDGVPGSLTNLNVNDIESVQVLKDAGSSSIYGVRGSNGVIVVTTNKGKAGDPKFTYDAYYGVTVPKGGNVFNLLNSEDYARLTKEVNPSTVLFANGLPDYLYASSKGNGAAMEGDPAVDPSKYNFDFNNTKNNYLIQKVNKTGTDWFHEVTRTAPTQSHNLSVSGGTNKTNYLVSLGMLDQEGTVKNTYLKRYSVRVNTQSSIRKNLRIGENLYSYYRQSPGFSNSSEGNAISNSFRVMPIIPVYDIMGNYGGTWIGPELGTTPQPVAMQDRTRNNKNNNWNVSGNAFAEVDFLKKHFTARTSFGGTLSNSYSYSLNYIGYNDREGFDGYNSFSEGASYRSGWTWTNTLNFIDVIGPHNIKVLLGSEAISNYGRNINGQARDYFSMDPDYMNLSNGTAILSSTSGAERSALYSLFSRLDYMYKEKYILGVTVRRDGSSVFGSEKRFGVFPSFSLGWRVTNEEFMKALTFISDLKLRGSYGVLGSQANISETNAFTLFSSGFGTSYYLITGQGNATTQGFFQSANGNPYTGWEENIVTNAGFDISFLENKLSVSVERYKKSINGLLFPQPLPATAGGASAPTINIGDIQNKGWDFSASYRERVSKDFNYSATASISTYRNKVVKIPGGYFDIKGSRIGNLVRIQEGQPVGTFYGYDIIGIFNSDEEVSSSPTQTAAAPGRFKYRDVNGDGQITSDDRTFFGDPNPDFTYGMNFAVNYKNLDFSMDFYGSQGNDALNFVRYYTDFMSTSEGKGRSNVLLNAWTPDNKNTTVTKLDYAPNFSTNSVPNSYYLEDGSFFKCRSLMIGYSINPDLLQKVNADRLRIYFQIANPFTITKYTGLDPELNGTLSGRNSSTSFGIDMGNYPNNQRQFLGGVKLTF
jgi:TonB-linked SusC/RagA family outer membrane protein